jgi:hypothetical protein
VLGTISRAGFGSRGRESRASSTDLAQILGENAGDPILTELIPNAAVITYLELITRLIHNLRPPSLDRSLSFSFGGRQKARPLLQKAIQGDRPLSAGL